MAFIRLFSSQVDPHSVEEFRQLFVSEVQPVFGNVEGCDGIELIVGCEPNAGGLEEVCFLSRWASTDTINAAHSRADVRKVAERVLNLLRQEPVVRLYEVLG